MRARLPPDLDVAYCMSPCDPGTGSQSATTQWPEAWTHVESTQSTPERHPHDRVAHLHLENAIFAVRAARHLVDAECRRAKMSPQIRDVAVLLTSELVTNAILHTTGASRLTIRASQQRVLVEVHDRSHDPPRPFDGPPESLSGLGLYIVRTLASRYGTVEHDDGKIVWFELLTARKPV